MKKYEVCVHGLEVIVQELHPSQFLTAMKNAGRKANALDVSKEALRMSVKQVAGVDVKYADLAGNDGWKKHFKRVRYLIGLAGAFNQIHLTTDDETDAFKDTFSIAVEGDDEDTEVWTGTLPDGRKVVLVEGSTDSLNAAMSEARKASKSEAATEFLTMINNVRKSLRSIDGHVIATSDLKGKKWDKLFGIKETQLLGELWEAIHAPSEQVTVGEMRPPSGTV